MGMASALQPEIWRPNMPGVRELITYSKPSNLIPHQSFTIQYFIISIKYHEESGTAVMSDSGVKYELNCTTNQ